MWRGPASAARSAPCWASRTVNIGHMSVARGKLGAEALVMVLTLDESLTGAQAEELGGALRPQYARPVEL